MPKSFRIKNLVDLGRWVPEDPELRDLTYFVDDGQTPRGAIRQMLFDNIESLRPGEYVLDQTIEDARQEVFARIDERSAQLIARGFEHEGIVFSTSGYAQDRYNAMLTISLAQISSGNHTMGISYPLKLNSLDDTDSLTVNNPVELFSFCSTALNYIRAQVDSGWDLKEAVRQATTQEELDAFVDNRGLEQLPPPSDGAETPEPEPEPESPPGDGGEEEETPEPEGGNQAP